MKLSDKIQILRKKNGMSQEILAEKCEVSRQCISKWELDISLPDTEKLLQLSDIFHISADVLLKDELLIDSVLDNKSCGMGLHSDFSGVYEGTLIKESIDNEDILDCMNIHKVELWRTDNVPRYWTAIVFSSDTQDLPQKLSNIMIRDGNSGVNWFVDLKKGNIKYVVFRNLVLHYTIGNIAEKNYVISKCKEQGIPENQMIWSE